MSTTAAIERRDQGAFPADDIQLRIIENVPRASGPTLDADDEANSLTKDNISKILAAGFSFFFAGTNDGSLGALIPYILRTYHVGTEYVALM